MNIEILSRKNSPLLAREEVSAKVEFVGGATPSREKIREELGKILKVDVKLVGIVSVINSFGDQKCLVAANLYAKEEDMKNIESQVSITRDAPKKKEGEEAEAKPEEKKEEKKE